MGNTSGIISATAITDVFEFLTHKFGSGLITVVHTVNDYKAVGIDFADSLNKLGINGGNGCLIHVIFRLVKKVEADYIVADTLQAVCDIPPMGFGTLQSLGVGPEAEGLGIVVVDAVAGDSVKADINVDAVFFAVFYRFEKGFDFFVDYFKGVFFVCPNFIGCGKTDEVEAPIAYHFELFFRIVARATLTVGIAAQCGEHSEKVKASPSG
jgi:hypothetical protein